MGIGDKVASFENVEDRNICLDALNEYYDLEEEGRLMDLDE